jgi:hypothetical protein
MIEIKPYVPKSWSYSAISRYEQCALQFYAERTKQVSSQESFALADGDRVHQLAEGFLLGRIEGVPPDLRQFEKEFKTLKSLGAHAEEIFVLDKNWERVDGWRHTDARLRAKIDTRVDSMVADFKTGRKYDSHEDQADLYSTIVFQAIPDLNDIDFEFWYLKNGDVSQFTFSRDQQSERLEKWQHRADILMSETEWKPTKNEYCKYCSVKKEHGCELFK